MDVAVEQDEALATYAPKIEKSDAEIDWALPAAEIARRVRAYNPFPGAFTCGGRRLAGDRREQAPSHRIKIWRASETQGSGEPGTVLQFDRDGIVVACSNAALRLEELQLPGKRRATAQEFLGQADLTGQRLGQA